MGGRGDASGGPKAGRRSVKATCLCQEGVSCSESESRGKFGRRRPGLAALSSASGHGARGRTGCFQGDRQVRRVSCAFGDVGPWRNADGSPGLDSSRPAAWGTLMLTASSSLRRLGSAVRNKQAFSSGGRVAVWLTSIPLPHEKGTVQPGALPGAPHQWSKLQPASRAAAPGRDEYKGALGPGLPVPGSQNKSSGGSLNFLKIEERLPCLSCVALSIL